MVGKSMFMFNLCFEQKVKALKEGKSVVFDLSSSEIATAYKNRDLSNNGMVFIDHVDLIKP